MINIRTITFGVLLAVVAAGCATANASGPPEIQYGRDICVECNMIISEARFATAYRLADGSSKKFDDVGDMVVHLDETGDAPTEVWVHDFETEDWVAAEVAFFVPTLSVASPMGHSILSFSDETRAQSFAHDVDGHVIDWATVRTLPAMNGLVGHHHMHEDEMMDDGPMSHHHHEEVSP
ncbi:MAG: nitrous oxide reductase accessory protein NosL [Acidimicrobiia bacterium]|nr:nitrous oxide reductase accessory protein NosL [Acidimicrobiia bacterium]